MNPMTKKLLQDLINTPMWPAITDIANEIITELQKESTVKETIDETAMATADKEGQIKGIKKLIDNIFNTTK